MKRRPPLKLVLLLLIVTLLVACGVSIEKAPGSAPTPAPSSENHATGQALAAPPTAGGNNFNVAIDLPQTYQQISAGDELWFTTKLMNLENQQRIDVTLTYEILDQSRQLQYSKSETVAIETQASFVAHLQTPATLSSEIHFLRVKVNSQYGESLAETTFTVTAEENRPQIVIKFSLFDIQVEIPQSYKTVQPGEELLTSIKLINVGTGGRIDLFMDYWITNEYGAVLLSEKETVAVETQNNFVRTFAIPNDAVPGKYTFHAKASYPGLELQPEYATTFTIAQMKRSYQLYYIFAGLVGAIVLVFAFLKFNFLKIFFEHRRIRKRIQEMLKGRK